MLTKYGKITCPLCLALGSWFPQSGDPQTHRAKQVETTITTLIESSAKFTGKRVHFRASYHSDGIERDVLMEPNCGRFDSTSKTPPPGEPQCARGIVPIDKTENDPGTETLVHAMQQGERSTRDKHITAEFTGKFRCVPSCAHPKSFELEIERVENVKVEMKNMKPHPPNE